MTYIRLAFRALACFVPEIVGELSTLPTTYRTFHKLREPETHRLTKIFRHFQQTFRHVAGTSRNLPTLWVLHFDPVERMGVRHDESLAMKLFGFIYHESPRAPRSVWLIVGIMPSEATYKSKSAKKVVERGSKKTPPSGIGRQGLSG